MEVAHAYTSIFVHKLPNAPTNKITSMRRYNNRDGYVFATTARYELELSIKNGVRFATVKTKKHSYNKKANHRYIYPVLVIVMHNNGT
ncbi:hypothetical protein PPTG_21466 [Phytophthora nicotianae INRA-310]|uniref:Uncharacterized protein n=1 Tax=Phytophthora nicotianae (strain INRA-310) TaxID=761204 RepID=W2R2C6_PHYN3|nr:hypothetical protein PPTG_21466 [Phytophthora nicotianae INRA-310]ETN19508.1 hypothetical protein PPTG_21466 [Phytophthora nicotianae INRA-310]